MNTLVDEILAAIPLSLRDLSGSAPNSGVNSWTGSRPVYLLGYNPGGAPGEDKIYDNAVNLLTNLPANHSAFRDEVWPTAGGRPRPAGEAPLQRRVRHLLDRLGLDPGEVPFSNLVYVRSRQVAHLPPAQAVEWAEACWPFHAAMIERLQTRVVVCFGGAAGWFVRSKFGAHTETDTFTENNRRPWTSRTYVNPAGSRPTVVVLTHPGRADWTNPATDPTGLVVRALAATAPTT